MKIITEKRQVEGALKTSLGVYNLLSSRVITNQNTIRANVIDDEGFDNWIVASGDYVVVPAAVPEHMNVKRVLTEKEEQETPNDRLITPETID